MFDYFRNCSSNAHRVCCEDSPTKGHYDHCQPWSSFTVTSASQTWLFCNWQYLWHYLNYCIQTWHDGRLMHDLALDRDFENVCKDWPCFASMLAFFRFFLLLYLLLLFLFSESVCLSSCPPACHSFLLSFLFCVCLFPCFFLLVPKPVEMQNGGARSNWRETVDFIIFHTHSSFCTHIIFSAATSWGGHAMRMLKYSQSAEHGTEHSV